MSFHPHPGLAPVNYWEKRSFASALRFLHAGTAAGPLNPSDRNLSPSVRALLQRSAGTRCHCAEQEMRKPLLKPPNISFSLAMGLVFLGHIQTTPGQLSEHLITNDLSSCLWSRTLPVWEQSCRDEKTASLVSMSRASERGGTKAEDSKLGAWIYFSFNKSKFLLAALRQNFKTCVIPSLASTACPSGRKWQITNGGLLGQQRRPYSEHSLTRLFSRLRSAVFTGISILLL